MNPKSIYKELYSIFKLFTLAISAFFLLSFALLSQYKSNNQFVDNDPQFYCGTCASLSRMRDSLIVNDTDSLYIKGAELFENNCKSCHNPTYEKLTGPGLAKVSERRSFKWIASFVRNSSDFIQKDKEAKKLYLEYNKTPMTSFPNLTDDDIKVIIAYLDNSLVCNLKKI